MEEYFDTDHARAINALRSSWTARTEWPTWLLIALIHGGWLAIALLVHAGRLSVASATAPLIVLCAWHMSLQHELLHGHPTRSSFVNKLLGSAPLSVWYPYAIYREAHLAHHRDEHLTEPGVDPESNYLSRAQWARLPRWQHALFRAKNCLIGRLVVGPPLSVAALFKATFDDWRRGDWRSLPTWLAHGALVALLLSWLQRYVGIDWWYYLLAITWPALSLAMVRSLREHRAAHDPKQRTVINEAGIAMRLLYLNNNYHLVHHDLPSLAWYHLPRAYRMRRSAYIAKNGGFVFKGGYWELLKRHAWRETDLPFHPEFSAVSSAQPARPPARAVPEMATRLPDQA